jgi:voltage-gated potassium channel
MQMPDGAKAPPGFMGSSYEGFILLLSLLSLCNILFLVFPGLYPDATRVITVMDLFLSCVFLFDFLFRLITAGSKARYILRDGGWADLLSSAPLPGMKIFRIFRVAKIVRLMRTYGIRRLKYEFSEQRAEGAVYFVFFAIIVILELSAILVLRAEGATADANIRTAGDALWWAYVTITTVGYGDQYPVTAGGRIVGVILMATGVSVFGTIAGFLSNKLIDPGRRRAEKHPATDQQGDDNTPSLRELKVQQEEMYRGIITRLEKIERVLAAGNESGDDEIR